MPRYFFHLRDSGSGVIDGDGIDLPDDASARENAATVARELMGSMKQSSIYPA